MVGQLLEDRVRVGKDETPRLVHRLDLRQALEDAVAVEDRTGSELVELLPQLFRREDLRDARRRRLAVLLHRHDGDLVREELVALDDRDRQAHAALDLFGLRVGIDDVDVEDRVLDDDVLVAPGLVDALDALDVGLVVRLAVDRVVRENPPEHRDFRLAHRVAQGLGGDVRVAGEGDRFDLDLVALVDREDDLLLGLREVLDLVVDGRAAEPLSDVGLRDDRPRPGDVPKGEGRADLDVRLHLLENVADLRARQLLVARELDLFDDRTLFDRHDQRDASGFALGFDVHVLEETDIPERVEVLPDLLRVVRIADLDAEVVRDRVGRHRLVADDPDTENPLPSGGRSRDGRRLGRRAAA